MSTKKNTGVSNHNPNVAPTQAGSEGTVIPSAATPATSAAGTNPAAGAILGLASVQWLTVESAIKTFREALIPALALLHTALHDLSRGTNTRTTLVTAPHREAAALYASILRQYPDITARVSADTIEGGLAVEAALAMVKSDFEQALPTVESCERIAGQASWSGARLVRAAAKALPDKDGVLEARIATAEALLHRGKLVTATANTAAKAQTAAAKAQQKAARAAAKAAKKAQTAARTAQVHAENHPLTPDVVIVPAGTTGSPPKG